MEVSGVNQIWSEQDMTVPVNTQVTHVTGTYLKVQPIPIPVQISTLCLSLSDSDFLCY